MALTTHPFFKDLHLHVKKSLEIQNSFWVFFRQQENLLHFETCCVNCVLFPTKCLCHSRIFFCSSDAFCNFKSTLSPLCSLSIRIMVCPVRTVKTYKINCYVLTGLIVIQIDKFWISHALKF